jgi:hypothetical protein
MNSISPLTVYNTWTSYISADGGEKIKRTEKKFRVRGQFAARGQDFVSATVTVDLKTKQKRQRLITMELGFVRSDPKPK